MEIKCRENLKIQIYHHPHYQSLNEKLMDEFSKLTFNSHDELQYYTNIKGNQLSLFGHPERPKGVDLIQNWVKQIIQNEVLNCNSKVAVPVDINFATWLARLDKGQETLEHAHSLYATLAFVYFVNAPKGSSPLIFTTSGKKIKAEPGKLVLFPGPLLHKVPVNKCDNRVTIASNITIIERGVA